MNYPIIFIDCETTGVSPKEDKIVEICLMKIKADGSKETKRTYVNPGIPIPPGATECHGITDEMVKDAPTFPQISKTVLEFIDGQDIATYNGLSYDIPLIYCELLRAGKTWDYSKCNLIDACNIFKRNEERTLSAAVLFYTGNQHEGAHGAESDCSGTAAVLAVQVEKYAELTTKTNKELALYSNYDTEILDLERCFKKNEQGFIVFNFGKYKDKVAADHRPYLEWMNSQDFMPDTKKIVYSLLYPKKSK